ncbi:plasmid replication protein [Mycobacterium gordonae]|uniref:Plasmid replication protein n=1 Tax=Mycobacterium gordonae TaxID=1778 RepID=A0A1A6BBT5_MYCGO|nr:helix-turn-helix domain-containing protein [Mycobacterium gordonae]OBR99774.1 plasmid replication protein [Mycobacterium gordonae]
MKDAFHGSAHPAHGLVTTTRGSTRSVVHPYRGSSRAVRRRGTARTAPVWIARAGAGCLDRAPRIVLEVAAGAAIPCWSGRARRWAHTTVPQAYQQFYDSLVRPAMRGNPVSLAAVVAVAEARASFADHRTGRDCRPSNARLAQITGLSVRTVQRASTALRLLGVATEVMRGRQRTRTERFASWRVGDRGRGWASVWALHDCRIQRLSPHPGGSQFPHKTSPKTKLTTATRRQAAGSTAATRRISPETRAVNLANSWVASQQSPPWARRYRTGSPWARVLAGPARHGWTARDVNTLISDWVATGHWVPESPHKPIGLLGAILAAHGDLANRPAALEVAREQEELARHRAHLAAQRAASDAHRAACDAGRAALSGPGRQAARKVLHEIAERARRGRHQHPGGSS